MFNAESSHYPQIKLLDLGEMIEAWIMADTSWMQQFEACSLSPRQVVLERIRNLEGDGVGLAPPLVENLKVTIDRLLAQDSLGIRNGQRWNWDGVRELKRILQIHSKVSLIDSDLAEELARQGSHNQLLRLLRLDLSTLTRRRRRRCRCRELPRRSRRNPRHCRRNRLPWRSARLSTPLVSVCAR
jgi:hypothetical protein